MKKKIICFDLDNVICTTKKNYYKKSKPKKNVIKLINNLHKKGHKILIFTARGMSTYKKNIKLILKNYKLLTEKQLARWDLKYDKLIFGKPSYDIYVDDKNYNFKKNWYKKFKINGIK